VPENPWDEFGVREDLVPAWQECGFSAFEAALAQGDGYGPDFAEKYRSVVKQEAAKWRELGLDTLEGLNWQRANFSATDAAHWIERGVGIDAAKEAPASE
jgi:hypothetical protein